MDAGHGASAILFAGWRYDPILPALSRREPSGAWRAVPLGSRALGVLGLLIEQRGAVVSKDCIMRAVWPATTVEPNNLTVQIATLRRVLDDGRQGESLIQTVPGQGYRLACDVQVDPGEATPMLLPPVMAAAQRWPDRVASAVWRSDRRWLAIPVLLLAAIGTVAFWVNRGPAEPPPISSMLSVGFEDVSVTAASALARSLAEDVANSFGQVHLFELPRDVVVNPGPVVTDPARLRRLGARYALQGTLHRLDTAISLDVQLFETRTGAQLWSQRLEIDPDRGMAARKDAVRRIASGVAPVVLTAEVRRRQQERPDRPTATDLTLQALLVSQLPPSPQRLRTERDLYERAAQLDPSSLLVKAKLAILLMDSEDYNPNGFKSVLERTRALVSDIRAAVPNSQMALRTDAQWLHWQDGRCPEAIEAARKLADMYPDTVQADRWLAQCLVLTGRAEEALPWAERAIQIAGLSDSWQFSNFRTMGDVLLDLGRFEEAIAWYRRGLAANPDIGAESQSRRLIRIASAQAFEGRIAEARQTMARAQALWPYWTVRGEAPADPASPASVARSQHLQEGLRLAGLRDHADEAADFGVAPIATLQQASAGHTSLTLPGATTLRTAEIAGLIAEPKVVIIDTSVLASGRSLPGAVGLRYVGAGGSLADLAQDRLRLTMQDLTKGDLAAPILVVGWNAEHLDGTNLALRLVALGYRNVFWYRGGREAWEASGGPEAPLTIREW